MHTLIILHGWGHSKDSWSGFDSNLPNIKQVIVWDLPGFGAEPLVSKDWGVPEYAKWVEDKISAQHLDDVILLGHSFGGRVSSYIASQNPTWLKGLILYGAPSIYRPSQEIRTKIRIAKLAKRLGLKRPANPDSDLAQADKAGIGSIFRKVVNFDQTDLLKQISVPTLLVWGKNDTEVPVRIAEETNVLIPGSKLQVLANVGHNAHLENPYLFYGTIKNFVQNL